VNSSITEPTAIDYVEWLLKHMLRASRTELTIDTRRPLPGAGEEGKNGAPPCMPSAETVINRLKILSGLSPVRYRQPLAAKFERPSATYTLAVATRFQDDGNASACNVSLRVRGRKG
jgi:hypothetical protein